MSDVAYQFRSGKYAGERSYHQTDQGLLWREGAQSGSLPYADIRKIRIFGAPNLVIDGMALPPFKICAISPRTGPALILSGNHFVRLGVVAALIQRVSAANPDAVFVSGMPFTVWAAWAGVSALIILVLALIVLVLIELIPKGEDLVTIGCGIFMLAGLLLWLPFILRMLVRDGRDASCHGVYEIWARGL